MAERYQRQISEVGAPGTRMQNFVTPEAAGMGVANALGQMGEGMNRLNIAVQSYNDKQEQIDLMAATNDFNRRMTGYLFDPEAGQMNTRKLKDARGLLLDTENHADKLVEDITSRLGEKAADQFRLVQERLRQPYTTRSATYEAQQGQAFEKNEAESGLQGLMQSVQADPLNPEMLEMAIDAGAVIIGSQMRGTSQESQTQAFKAWASQLETAQISMILGENPLAANQMIQGAKYLLPADRAALEAKVRPEVERVEVQAFVDDHVLKFPPGTETEGIQDIRRRFNGAEEEQRVAGYKTRISELTIDASAKKESMSAQRKEITEQLYADYTAQGKVIPRAVALQLQSQGILESGDVERIDRWNESVTNVAKIKDRVLSQNPYLSPEELHVEVQKELGISPVQGQAIFYNMRVRVMGGTATKSDVEYYKNQGWLSPAEAEQLTELESTFGKEQQKFFNDQRDELIKTLEATTKGKPMYPPEFQQAAVSLFADMIKDLKPDAPNYREQVTIARQQAVLQAADLYSGKKNGNIAKLAEAYQQLRYNDTLDNGAYNSAMGLQPTTGRTLPGGAVSNSGQAMIPGVALQKTGSFTDWRPYRNGQHNGVDYAAPAGTPIVSPDIGVPLTVVHVGAGSESAGNFVKLEGKLSSGEKIEMQISHMQDGSIPLKKGEILSPGGTIGRVGSTGVSSGPHMDLKIKINGKYVDPDMALPALVNRQIEAKSTVAQDLGDLPEETRKKNVSVRQQLKDEEYAKSELKKIQKQNMTEELKDGPVR